MNFAGQRMATKIFPVNFFQVHNRCKEWLKLDNKFFSAKKLLLSRNCKTTKYLPHKNFRLYGIRCLTFSCDVCQGTNFSRITPFITENKARWPLATVRLSSSSH